MCITREIEPPTGLLQLVKEMHQLLRPVIG